MESYKKVKDQFLKNVKNHTAKIELDNGVFRSIKFSNNNSWVYYFRITTWPGHLCISGDMGTYVFSRVEDMFKFFRGDTLEINPDYWTQKLTSVSCFGSQSGEVKEFDAEATYDEVKEYVSESTYGDVEGHLGAMDKLEKLKELLEYNDANEACCFLDELGVQDAYDSLRYKHTHHILWCLYAIRWAIMQYDAQANMDAS